MFSSFLEFSIEFWNMPVPNAALPWWYLSLFHEFSRKDWQNACCPTNSCNKRRLDCASLPQKPTKKSAGMFEVGNIQQLSKCLRISHWWSLMGRVSRFLMWVFPPMLVASGIMCCPNSSPKDMINSNGLFRIQKQWIQYAIPWALELLRNAKKISYHLAMCSAFLPCGGGYIPGCCAATPWPADEENTSRIFCTQEAWPLHEAKVGSRHV